MDKKRKENKEFTILLNKMNNEGDVYKRQMQGCAVIFGYIFTC